jgi:localization factor PodJL
MKPGIPWSVKGIEPETREAAKDAARRSGMTLGEWLNSKILDSADEQDSAPPVRHQRALPARAETSIRLEDIAEQLSRIARREQKTAPASYVSEYRLEDEENFARILNRVESNERQTVEAFTAVNERLAVLSRQVLQTAKMPTISKPEESAPFKSLETAVRNIVEHIEISERRTRDSLKSMQDRMAEMAQRATSSSSEEILQSAPAFTSLESRLNELANRVERSESKSAAGLSDILRVELSQLAERIETVRESSEILASKAQTAAVQTSQAELREIEKRILSLLKEAQIAFSGQGGSTNVEMQRLRSEISALNQRIDSARADTASERDVHALRVAVEQLSSRVAQGPDMRPLADMDRRLVDITQRLEQSQQAARNNPQFSDLERRMAELDYRLEEAMRSQGDGQAQIALEQKISEVADRLGQTEHQLGHLETIERAINQLFDSVEQSRDWAKDVAEDAANRMADRLMNAPNAAPLMLGSSPELKALEDGLQAVRESAIGADKRNQETLQAVHDTLEQIVTKLAELETAAVGQQVAAAAAHGNQFATPDRPAENWKDESYQVQPMPEPSAPEPELVSSPSSSEPQSQVQEASQANPLMDWLSKSTMPGVDLPSHDEEAAPDDFITAARRAAQASAQKSILASLAPSAKSARKKLNLPFMKAASKPNRDIHTGEKLPPEIKPAANKTNNKRRTLVLAGLVLLAAVTAFTFNMLNKPQKSSSATPPAPIEGTVQPGVPSRQSKAMAPANAPASQLLMNKTADRVPSANRDGPNSIDDILTGSMPDQKTDATLASIVAEPGTTAGEREMPPAELGSEALRSAAERGDASAQFIIATRYLDGEGVTQDVTRAAHWYQKAALVGLAPAQYRLATLFERGRGVPKDTATALVWYERAAAQGNVKAMHNAAVIAAGTEAGKPNYDLAHKWFLAASRNGLKDSQFNLAVMYERALGTKANADEALFWYLVAASQNDADARKRAEVLSQNLSPVLVEKIRARAKAWIPQRAPENANVVTIQDAAWQSPPTMSQLSPATSAVEKQQAGNDPIGEVQQLLNKLGFNIGEPDGRMGVRTTNAIRLFQLQYGLKVTGEVTADLISQLQARTS